MDSGGPCTSVVIPSDRGISSDYSPLVLVGDLGQVVIPSDRGISSDAELAFGDPDARTPVVIPSDRGISSDYFEFRPNHVRPLGRNPL